MNSEQYKRANNNSFYVTIIILLSGLFLTVFSVFQYGASVGRISIIVSSFICVGICALGNFKYPYEKKGAIMLMGGATIFYFVILIAEESLIYFAFGLPILICSIIYLNVRLCKFGIGAIIISFVITCIKVVIVTGAFNLELIPAAITLGLAFIACLCAVTLLTMFNEENNAKITKNAEETLETGNAMAEIANTITELFNKSQDNMVDLQNIMDAQHSGMQDIASSMESTAQSVTTQYSRFRKRPR